MKKCKFLLFGLFLGTFALAEPNYVYYAEGWDNPDKFEEHDKSVKENLQYWDNILNKEYKRLMTSKDYSSQFKASLKTAQLAWIKYRDAVKLSIDNFYAGQGSLYFDSKTMDIIKITKNRALELQGLRLFLNE